MSQHGLESSSLLCLDALDAGCWRGLSGRGLSGHGLFGALDGGREGDLALCLDIIDWNAEHLAAYEVGDVDVLDFGRRHCGLWFVVR